MANLIEYSNTWDAVKLIEVAQKQIWDEYINVLNPGLDDTQEKVPEDTIKAIFWNPGYALLERASLRILAGEWS